MRSFVLLLSVAVAALAVDPPGKVYEEEVKASVPVRNRAWHLMGKYIDSLPEKGEPSGKTFAKKIGYPAPHIEARHLRLEKIASDSIATYYRAYTELGDVLEGYGLYIVPHGPPGGPYPLVIAQHGGGGSPELALFHGGANYHDMIRGAVRHGYVVYAPLITMYPYVDRDNGTEIQAEVRRDFDNALRKRGTSLFAVETTMISEALTLLLKRPEVDRKRTV